MINVVPVAQALLAPQTRIEDVLFGLYNWLDNHPTEAVLVSMNYEVGTGTPNDAALQEHLYSIFQSDLAKKYWVQTNGTVCVSLSSTVNDSSMFL